MSPPGLTEEQKSCVDHIFPLIHLTFCFCFFFVFFISLQHVITASCYTMYRAVFTVNSKYINTDLIMCSKQIQWIVLQICKLCTYRQTGISFWLNCLGSCYIHTEHDSSTRTEIKQDRGMKLLILGRTEDNTTIAGSYTQTVQTEDQARSRRIVIMLLLTPLSLCVCMHTQCHGEWPMVGLSSGQLGCMNAMRLI